jgi:hypothetical protein
MGTQLHIIGDKTTSLTDYIYRHQKLLIVVGLCTSGVVLQGKQSFKVTLSP